MAIDTASLASMFIAEVYEDHACSASASRRSRQKAPARSPYMARVCLSSIGDM